MSLSPSSPGDPNQPGRNLTPRWQFGQRFSQFVQAKLILTLAVVIIYASVLPPHWERVLALAVAALIDVLQLIPYGVWISRRPRAEPTAVILSAGFSTVIATIAIFLVGDLVSPVIVAYLVLNPLACLFVPRMKTAFAVASMSSLSYLTLLALQANGLIPALRSFDAPGLPAWLVPALVVVPIVWAGALLTGRIATSLERQHVAQLRLYDETQRRAEAEKIWNSIGKTVISTQDLERILGSVIQLIHEKMPVERAWVLLSDAKTGLTVSPRIFPNSAKEMHSTGWNECQRIVDWVVTTGQTALVTDVAHDKRWGFDAADARELSTNSVLCVPLIAEDKPIGAIELVNKLHGVFSQDDVNLLVSIAAPVAIAIQNARLHHQVQQQLQELKRLFAQVEHAKQEWETSVDVIEEGIILLDKEGKVLRVNRTIAEWLHTTPVSLVGQYCHKAVHGDKSFPGYCPFSQMVAASDHAGDLQAEYSRSDGTFRCVAYPLQYSSGALNSAVVVVKNITSEQRLQAHLMQSEKLAATGRMAASLAHEINNPLQAIQGCLDLAQANPTDMQKQQRYLTMAKSEVDRLAAIVQRMLDFYRPSGGGRTRLNARELVEDVLVFSGKRLQHAKVSTHIEWDAKASIIEGNANQLKQVFLNIVLNAVDAMPGGGELAICGRTVEKEGSWLTIAFSDSGAGIPADSLAKIFEPFFTTKPTGTGLGLGISHSIIVGHGGQLTVDSTLGTGSTFTVWLPVENHANGDDGSEHQPDQVMAETT